MRSEHFDIVIIGSGAGGGTMAHALSDTGARVRVVERGEAVPQEPENWSPAAVWKDLRYRTKEQWANGNGETFTPYTHYVVGGNTKFWGCVLYRFRKQDFEATEHLEGISPAWPIDYDALAPYYDRAERLYQVHGAVGDDPTEPPRGPYPHPPVPHARGMTALVDAIRAQGLHPSPLPLGLIDPGAADGCILCRTCNSFPCRIHRKSDAEVCCVQPAMRHPNVTLVTRATAQRLITDASGRRVEAVEIERDGQRTRVTADRFVVSCGAVNSAALLLRSASDRHPDGLANSSGMVGTRYMAHLATMMQGVGWRVNRDEFQKTLAINDFYLRGPDTPYPLGQIQSQGRTDASMAKVVGDGWRYKFIEMRHIPLWAYEIWVSRATDWLAMTEDLPRPENRVTIGAGGQPMLSYRPNNRSAHARLVEELRGLLARLGYWSPKIFAHSTGPQNTTHQCGTLCFGTDPRTSVLDPFCRTHDVENLFVVDASFFPSSAAVNPGLTIIAQALRVADHIKASW
ncbi:MAG TPA: GMC family oxidoreductase [Vicinamibacterales bacterium]|nr:GMC family oxidoreductase [Vicinamibacterales bacterium]